MKLLLLIAMMVACGGCATPIFRTLSDTPPWNAIEGRIIVTARSGHLSRNNPSDPLGDRPSRDYRYSYGTDYIDQLMGIKPDWPMFPLPKGTKLRITRVRRVTYTPLPSYFSTTPHNEIEATIVSGSFAGVKLWAFWGDTPHEDSDFSFDY